MPSKRPPLDEQRSLWEATVAAEGTTTAPGAAAGNSFIDAGLAGAGANSFFSMLAVLYPGQPRLVDSMDITGFNDLTGEVTLSTAYKGVAAPIPAGVPYKIVTFRFVPAEVAALTALVVALMADVGDASTSVLGSIFGILGDPAIGEDLATRIGYEGALSLADKLTAARAALIDEITALRMAELDPAGLPAEVAAIEAKLDLPAPDAVLNTRIAEITGNKSDTIPAMNLAPGATDSIIRHIKAILERLGQTPADPDDSVLTNIGQRDDAATLDDMSDVTTTSIQAKLRRILLRLSTDAFTANIQGVARTELDTMLAQLATYFVAAGGALSVTIDPGGVARSSLATLWNDLGQMLAGATGITTWPARAKAANTVSMAEAIRDIDELKPEWAARTSATHTTTGATEETILTTAYTTPGLFYFNLTLRNMVAGDDFTIRVYKRVDGANYDLKSAQNFVDAPLIKVYEIEGLYTDGTEFIRVTIQRNSGTNRAFPYSYNIIKQAVA